MSDEYQAWTGSTPPPQPYAGLPQTPIQTILRQTKPWVRFMSILGFISAGLMIVGGLLAGIAMAASGKPQGLALAVVYPILGAIYFIPSLFLSRYASRINEFLASGTEGDLSAALGAQKSFWKFVGIFSLVMISLYVVLFVIAMLVTLAASMR